MSDDLASRRWFSVAVGALTIAGILSLVLVFARAPLISQWIQDPLFARRCLAVHVNLAMFVWLVAMVACLYHLFFPLSRGQSRLADYTPLAFLGMAMFVFAGGIPNVHPVLSNYVPVLESPLFFLGMALVALAFTLTFLQPVTFRRLVPACIKDGLVLPGSALSGIRIAAVLFLLTILTLVITLFRLPPGFSEDHYYEMLFWGAGHQLQFVNVAGMMTVWCLLAWRFAHRDLLSSAAGRWVFSLLLLPALLGPFFAYRVTQPGHYRILFTRLMQFGIFPSVLLAIALLAVSLFKQRQRFFPSAWRSPWFLGLLCSMLLTVTGFLLGAFIRTSNTLIPAHYHASIGGVTVAYMTISYWLVERFRVPVAEAYFQKLARWQPGLFGFGQLVFAVGFGMAAMGRKLYGVEQLFQTPIQVMGMSLMVLGGLLAVVGGILFVLHVGWAVSRNLSTLVIIQRRALWQSLKNIPFRN